MDQQDPTKKRKIEDTPENANTDGMDPSEREERITLMLSTMRRDDLQSLLAEAALLSGPVYEKVVAHANADPTSRKLFVRGLAYSTTSDAVKSFFSQYGVIEEGTVVCNREGQSKGFGFITFTDLDAAHRAIKEPRKQIDGRTVFCNLAAAGNQGNGGAGGAAGGGMSRGGGGGGGSDAGGDTAQRKLFVRGISYETTNDTFLHHFGRYGEVEEGGVVIDKQTDKCKGFGFVTFRTIDSARKALEQPSFFLDGRTVHVNLAEEGKRNRDMGGGGQHQQQQGGWNMQGGQQNMQGFQGHNHAAAMAAATAAWAAWNQGPRPGAPQAAQYGGYAPNPAAYQQQQQPGQPQQQQGQPQQVSAQPSAGVPGQQQQQPQPGQQQAGYPGSFPFARPPGYMQG
jgi:heterogeneous nuclear ribonucleoprotein A1/A3